MTVSDLMLPNRREWNTELINLIFPVEERRKIYSHTLQGLQSDDIYSWEYTKSGHYSVKSGYWVQVNVINAASHQEEQDQPSLDLLYQRAWKQETSPKIQHFLWRCISNSLPAAANMKHRHISKDGSCLRCGQDSETVNHILFQCPYARLVWASSPIHAPPNGVMSDSLYSNLYRVLSLNDHYPPEEAFSDLVPWLLWRLWKSRNDFIFQGKDYLADDTVAKAMENTKEWKRRTEANQKEVKKPTSIKQCFKWKPPPHDWIKCNTDGSWHKDTQEQGIGWVARDAEGRMLWAGAQRFYRLSTPIETEATALLWAVRSLISLRYTHVIFETDSQVLVRMIEGTEAIWPKLKPIILELSGALTRNRSYRVEYFSRDGNKSADRVAREALSFENYVPKLYSVLPSWLKPVVEADMPDVEVNFVVGLNHIG